MNKIRSAVRNEFPPVIKILDNTEDFDLCGSLEELMDQLRDEEDFHINYYINCFKDFENGKFIQINIAGEEVYKMELNPDIDYFVRSDLILEIIRSTIRFHKDKINAYDAKLQEKIRKFEEQERYAYLMHYFIMIGSPKALYYAKKAAQKCPIGKYEGKLANLYLGRGQNTFCYKNPALAEKIRRSTRSGDRNL